MHIVHVTPHLPPDQAANALLPWRLGEWARERGDTIEYVAHPPLSGRAGSGRGGTAGNVTWLPRRTSSVLDRGLRIGSLTGAWRVWRAMSPVLARADLVHVHSNGLLPELAVLLARRAGKPVVLTLYGTEIWHYAPRRPVDLFTRAYHAASAVTFYSARLHGRALELGLTRRGLHVIYPPVPEEFAWHDEQAQARARAELHVQNRHLLLNVKRLHPLAGQRHLIEAMTDVVRTHPDTRLVICGEGALREELQAAARSAGVERHIMLAGLIDNRTIAQYCAAADLFVLPSLLEALPTVAVEALASGTPVLSSDNPGGLELNDVFGPDVAIVPREAPVALGSAIAGFLSDKRRTRGSTREILERTFRPAAVAAQYRAVYEAVA
ncbi:MAG: glycosyltransferase family 4 protein [Acidobacteria bacterium]|nr:glycosyltransferase family 4 protein [Acidobacteriota bacterium]